MLFRLGALAASLPLLAACGGTPTAADGTGAAATGAPLEVTVGFYPYAFVAQRVGGSDVAVVNLTAPGGEPHDLDLSPQQVAALQETDLVVYSRGFQPAVDEAVEQSAGDRAFDVLTAVELREGAEHAEDGDEEPAQDAEEHTEEGAGDPHVWLDPMRLATIAEAVAEQLGQRAPARAEAFAQRAGELRTELEELDRAMSTGLARCTRKQIVTSHDAFGYLAGAYGLEQVSLTGLSPEEEASPKRLAEVARYAKEKGVTTIFFEELVSPKVAQSLAREVGARAVELNPLESPPGSGDYVTAMRSNLQTLRTALDCT